MSFRQAVARFSAEVEQALTRARRAAREAKAETTDFRRRTEELAGQAKTGKLRGLRRAQVAPTSQEGHAEATKFRSDNGLPVPELPTADELINRLPNRAPEPVVRVAENEDFSQHQVLFDVGKEQVEPSFGVGEPPAEDPDRIDSPEPAAARSSDGEEDFSQQRILLDATVESYRPEDAPTAVFEPGDRDNPR